MPKFKQYSESPLHSAIVQLLTTIETIRKNPNYAVGANQQERKSIDYLNHIHETVTTLHEKILPLFSKGNYPNFLDMYKLIKFKGMASQLKNTTKSTIDVMLDVEIARALVIFIGSLPDESLSAIAPFLDVNKIPDVAKTFLNTFLGMGLFKSNTTLQTDLRLKRQTLQSHIAAFEEKFRKSTAITKEQHDSNVHDRPQEVRPPIASAHSMFFTKKPSIEIRSNPMDKDIEPHSPHSPVVV